MVGAETRGGGGGGFSCTPYLSKKKDKKNKY